MLKNCIIGLVSVALLVMSVIKFSTRPAESASQNRAPTRTFVLFNKSIVTSHRSQLGHDAKLADIFLLRQKIQNGEKCSFGLFRLIKISNEKATLKAVGTRMTSRFAVWAESQGKAVEWEWQSHPGKSTFASPGQQCWSWRKESGAEKPQQVVVSGNRFFIRGSRYAEIVQTGNKKFRIESDPMREGWWVTSSASNAEGLLILRSAMTGLLESIPIKFNGKKTKTKIRRSNVKQSREIRKSFALPGWE
ncbi:MAG: hypothetical protein ACO3A4_08120 [Silvanigrellaceae bacterium]